MHRALSARWLNRALSISEATTSAGVPLFLCPAVGYTSRWSRKPLSAPTSRPTICARRYNHTEAATTTTTTTETPTIEAPVAQDTTPSRKLPLTCSGCGSFSQTNDAQQFGYFDVKSRRVKKWLSPKSFEKTREATEEDSLVDDVLKKLDASQLEALGLDTSKLVSGQELDGEAVDSMPKQEKQPVCERCHNLVNYSTHSDTAKIVMHHPTVESLRETIEESPHKYNHIYHVIDAADFPMSLIPRLNVLLGDIPMRSRNRRSRADKYQKDRKTDLSFIITRSDLLGPTKEIVDHMMPYLREVLRDALGRLGGRIRLGNLKCVSAKRAWWTKDVKDDIWDRGGAGWMVGKVNVGKSQLFEAVYPKGRMSVAKGGNRGSVSTYPRASLQAESITTDQDDVIEPWKDIQVGDLLPPPQPEKNYPDMPLVSSLPGTTASPIRVPFGNGKGELIDLPGLARSDLDLFVKEEFRQSIIMKKRIVPEQISVKAGKSLILGGGLIRITPKTPDTVFLMYNFTPLDEHLTQDEKAIGFQEQTRHSAGLENITLEGVGEKMKHAGTFKLRDDVTRSRAGPLTRKNAVGLQVDRLPFRVLSTDILIEGVGYVEIVAQVRARDLRMSTPRPREPRSEPRLAPPKLTQESSDPFADLMNKRRGTNESSNKTKPPKRIVEEEVEEEERELPYSEPNWPEIDVFSPEGRFIGSRQPINGWLNNKPRVLAEHRRSRPRRSMKGQKKKDKAERRATTSSE